MSANIIAKAEVFIEAPANKVWEALTTPEIIKQYLFGTQAISDFTENSELRFVGEWEGKSYEEKGEILKIIPEKLFQFTSFSSLSNTEDVPENYRNITYELEEDNGITKVSLRQTNNESEEAKDHAEANWKHVLEKLKEVVENQETIAH